MEGGERIMEGLAEAQFTRAPTKRADAISTELQPRADAISISSAACPQTGLVEQTEQGELIITPNPPPDGLQSAAGGGAHQPCAAPLLTSEPLMLTTCSSGQRSEAAGDEGGDTRRGGFVVHMPQPKRPRSGAARGGTQREIAGAQREMRRGMQPEVTGGQWEMIPGYVGAGGMQRPQLSPARPRTTSRNQALAADAPGLVEAAHLQAAPRGDSQRGGAANLEVAQWLEAQGGAIAAGSSGLGLLGLKILCHRRSVRCAAGCLTGCLTDSQPEATQLRQPLGEVIASGTPLVGPLLETSTRLQMQRKMRRRARSTVISIRGQH